MAMLANIDSPEVVYDLRRDTIKLSQMQQASLSSGNLGLAMENGIVVGSPKWWQELEAGRIRLEHFSGVIRQVDAGPMGDSTIVRIEGTSHTKSWAAWEGFDITLRGKRVDVVYARIPPKRPPEPGFLVDLLIQVRVVD